jgi:hypothetical protein
MAGLTTSLIDLLNGLITVFPEAIHRQQVSSLATRWIVPSGPTGFELYQTLWCYADDAPEMKNQASTSGETYSAPPALFQLTVASSLI